ncbi:MAG TPA: universal stress protein [Xanthomonadaceae bacterium]|nr:universal stress protein [Xanthomonadaceae bacterium]
MSQTIIAAFDGSRTSTAAYHFALKLAAVEKAPLLVLAVAQPPDVEDHARNVAELEAQTSHFEEAFQALAPKAAEAGVEARFRVVEGHPVERILEQAKAVGAGHIVVGNRRKGIFEWLLLGSVAKRIVDLAPCSVTVVR